MRESRLARETPARLSLAAGIAAFTALMLLTDLFYFYPGIDLAVARWAGGGAGFPLADIALLKRLRSLGFFLFEATCVLAMLGLALPFLAGGRRFLLGPLWSLAFLVSAILGPGLTVNALLKEHWGRPRPHMLAEFGGDAPYTPVWVISDTCRGNCSFVSGEASTAILLVTLVLAVPPAWRRATLLLTLGLAAAVSTTRVLFGGHFLSDVLLSWCLTLIIAALCHGIAGLWPAGDDRLGAALGRAGAAVRSRLRTPDRADRGV